MMDAVAVLPVRLASTRIPCKALVDLAGRPMLWHVWQHVLAAGCFRKVVVATDAEKVRRLVESWGGSALPTSGSFSNGTERIASIAGKLKTSHIVNVQADMPRIDAAVFQTLLRTWAERDSDLITPVYALRSTRELHDPHVVKVAHTESDHAAYFSRHPIPYARDVPEERWLERRTYWGHIGIYGVTTVALQRYAAQRPSSLEIAESLEQLRFLELGIPIATFESPSVPLRVDSPEDLSRAREYFSSPHEADNSKRVGAPASAI